MFLRAASGVQKWLRHRLAVLVFGVGGITPYVAGQVTTFLLPAYAESAVAGNNTFALSYTAKDVTATRSELGLRTDKSFAVNNGILTLRAAPRGRMISTPTTVSRRHSRRCRAQASW